MPETLSKSSKIPQKFFEFLGQQKSKIFACRDFWEIRNAMHFLYFLISTHEKLRFSATKSEILQASKPAVLNAVRTYSSDATNITCLLAPIFDGLREAPDDEASLSKILDRFAYWHTFSTIWQLFAFIALVVALANL
jgi:hypothetical protein